MGAVGRLSLGSSATIDLNHLDRARLLLHWKSPNCGLPHREMMAAWNSGETPSLIWGKAAKDMGGGKAAKGTAKDRGDSEGQGLSEGSEGYREGKGLSEGRGLREGQDSRE